MKYHPRYTIWAVGSILLLGLMGSAQGQSEQLTIGNTNPVLDHVGRPFPGIWMSSNTASRVEVREVGLAIIPPDPSTGAGNDTLNPLLLGTYMGFGVIGTNATGIFSYNLDGIGLERLPEGVEYFARVYDAPLTSEAYYYANSLPFQDVPPGEYSTTPTVYVNFQSIYLVNGGDDTDSDGDLLPDWMEFEITSTDPNAWDSDEDGYYDGFEELHSDYLVQGEKDENAVQLHTPVFSGDPPQTNEYYVSWWAIPGVFYQLEYRDAMTDGLIFTNIWDGTASQTNVEISVDDWVQTNVGMKGFFRYLIP